ncbi:MAG TPA: hypothetical protein VHF69_07345 [Candidatus Synoicihabitans sp.]|nr:hypothetical protein [Candidatus Synoicihabitans sp.]
MCWHLLPRLSLVSCVVAGLFLAGCSSPDRRANRAPQPLLLGRSSYFSDQVRVEVVLGPFRLHVPGDRLDRRTPEPGDGEPVPIAGGRFGSEAGMGFPRGPGEAGAFGAGGGGGGVGRRGGPPGGMGGAMDGLPRQSITVTIRSAAAQPLTVRVVEVKSALGNFVPVPEQFTLAPGAEQPLEPMRASYPAPIDELEMLVVLRLDGREESQVVKLALANGGR